MNKVNFRWFNHQIILLLTGVFWFLSSKENMLFAQINKSLVLDGRSNYFEVNHHYDLNSQGAISIEFWINPNCIDYVFIFAKQRCNGQFGYSLAIRDGKLVWDVSPDGSCNNNSTYETNAAVIKAYDFTHVAVVQNQTSMSIYIDGTLVPGSFVQGSAIAPRASTRPLLIGAYTGISGNHGVHPSCLIDEFRFWKTALTFNQINQRMNSSLTGNEQDLVLYFDMEENGIGTTAQLINKANTGSTFNAIARGTTDQTPYFSLWGDYTKSPFQFPDTIQSCDNVLFNSNPSTFYHSLTWNTGQNTPSINLTNRQEYRILMEREKCAYFGDTLFFNKQNNIFINETIEKCKRETINYRNLVITNIGTYRDTVSAQNGCDTIFIVQVNPLPDIYRDINIQLCIGESMLIGSRLVSQGGIYNDTVTTTSGCDTIKLYSVEMIQSTDTQLTLRSCDGANVRFLNIDLKFGIDTQLVIRNHLGCDSFINVQVLNKINENFLGKDLVTCEKPYKLRSPKNNTIWSNSDTSNEIKVIESGIYFASYFDNEGCLISDTIKVEILNNNILMPNSFSPNNDNLNDCFRPILGNITSLTDYRFQIYNRWGELIFNSIDLKSCWNGIVNHKPAQDGVYMYVLIGYLEECQSYFYKSGTVTLLR
jgi:gliding motility-associated-like protein